VNLMGVRHGRALALTLAMVCASPLAATEAAPPVPAARPADHAETARRAAAAPAPAAKTAAEAGADRICALIEDAAGRHRVPPEFMARLLWKESRFDVKALSPKGAQGVAQFMPGTAKLRGLADPWDPEQAIHASAEYLADLRRRFGNLGLAAAAYNSGENRVERWLNGETGLPYETVDYVQSITYRPAEWFKARGREVEHRPLDDRRAFAEACRQLPVMRTRAVLDGSGARQPWAVQIATNLTQAGAARSFAIFKRRYPGVLGDKAPMVVRNKRKLRAPGYAVRVGAASRQEAARLCGQLRAAGAPCAVMRN
jgi:hypothetical protein